MRLLITTFLLNIIQYSKRWLDNKLEILKNNAYLNISKFYISMRKFKRFKFGKKFQLYFRFDFFSKWTEQTPSRRSAI